MAEGVFKDLLQKKGLCEHFHVASAATGRWHVGYAPHSGTQAVLAKHGISLPGKHAQMLKQQDLENYDYLVVMDAENVNDVHYEFGVKLPRLLEFANGVNTLDVPDPYYHGNFDIVYELVLKGCLGLLDHIVENEGIDQ